MIRWIMRIGVVAALVCVTGMVCAQGRGPGGPPGRPYFGPRDRAGAAESRDRAEPPRAPAPTQVAQREEDEEEDNQAENESRRGEGKGRFEGLFFHAGHRPRLAVVLIGLLALLVVVPVLVTLLWVLPIALGVWIARRRNLSPLWMLFGIHPLGGWIACLVLALSRGKVECATCGGHVKRNYRQCPHCHGALPGPASAKSPA